jgi:tetratricopeptide (TPR) repeat protein
MADYSTALPYLKKALKILKQSTSCSPAIVADVHGNLVQILFNLDQHEEAVPYAERALDVAIDIFGTDHPKILMFPYILEPCNHKF